ncbi:tripartite tricarboxylate transporter substrate-binding protein [Polynucleobacter paneuropaeus]|jgi:tripartite-type tricarboxylate transporter receptor subunit TctC|uniref:Tripartite tricarboxylate transporter substrate binding protein BugD n=1 Tax=Polynucleobacter paneuropaeus TaxID=2527775 RepID=A0A2Z4JRN0_9BURK|nr:tripartite tricarboxylate transporter substrate-binding protein [Polynucleobacter paneuropaeus]AWW44742.1 tripartite tricarboxylate transporter substrate binding protein BugD [Polynucleobacter paneuropaeus]AWW49406.1 tripartite tricarboxylate transporter substrate binding protein BugD [Polynucleobacter paneuropaeus]MBT8518023.1 tripartite tricarboxylate transporter substrate binding protein BugD [Polynucleobacter paneuropaeus]MBT8520747.1 tripartite tricarboxylate transporter substrate bindi
MKPHQKLHTSLLAGLIAIAASSYLSIAPAMAADAYPNKPITLVVPFSAGGPTDAVARLIAVPMGKDLGQTVIVENTVGAGGTIATTRVARAAPDGYILYLHHMGMATAPALYKKLPFDPMKDFEYIGQVVDVPMVLLGRKNFPANNFKELEAYIKVNKEKVTIANAGPGSVSQLCGLLLMSREGVELTTVPYKGTGPALTDLLGGQVDLLCDQTTQTVPYIKDNLVKAYGVTTLKRLPGLSNIPTLDEQGLKGFEVKAWHGLYAPKGTPPEVLAKINKALRVALNNPEVKARLGESNIEVVPMSKVTSESLKNQLDSEINKWGPVIRKAGAYAD